jgi:tetratricopeptide (TPR) repeat protein
VEVARAKLAAGDLEEAVRRAERALSHDPSDESALGVLREARQAKGRVDEALAAARAARTASDQGATALAFWALLESAPDHSVAADLVPALDRVFRSRAEEAQRLMAAARQAAEKAEAMRRPAFAEGASLTRAGEAALSGGRFAEAAREFMRARVRYERAARATH